MGLMIEEMRRLDKKEAYELSRSFNARLITNSLFIRLLVSFVLVIVLLLTYILFSFSYFNNYIRSSIVEYNSSNLMGVMKFVENHLEESYFSDLKLYSDDKVQILNNLVTNSPVNYETMFQIYKDISNAFSNPASNIENRVLNYLHQPLVIGRAGTTNKELFFSDFFRSERYSAEFWNAQFNEDYTYRIFPAEKFFVNHSSSKLLIPTVVKSKYSHSPQHILLTFHDIEKLLQSASQSKELQMYLLDESGSVIYSNLDSETDLIDSFNGQVENIIHNNNYYFYKKGVFSKLTYVNVISIKQLSSNLARLNITLISLLVVSLLIAIATSIFLSMNFNKPIKRIVRSVQQVKPDLSLKSSIIEFKDLNTNVNSILKSMNDNIPLLKSYSFIDKLKKIRSQFPADNVEESYDTPFVFILFHIYFKAEFKETLDKDTTGANYYVREFIHVSVLELNPKSLTLQIEQDQILSILFDIKDRQAVLEKLSNMVEIFNKDKQYFFLSISLGSIHTDSHEFTKAFEEVQKMDKQRKFHDRTEIIDSLQYSSDTIIEMTSLQIQEFDANLKSGNYKIVYALVTKMLQQMAKTGATTVQFWQFSDNIINRASIVASQSNVDISQLSILSKTFVHQCYTYSQLDGFFAGCLFELCEKIRENKKEKDKITEYVFDYINNNYNQDIGLDMMADNLNVTAGYLSWYIKVNTGTNFMDYLNQVRIEKAKELLELSNERIKNIAGLVGYQNMNSFHTMFKKYTGITPKEYRQSKNIEETGE